MKFSFNLEIKTELKLIFKPVDFISNYVKTNSV